MTRKKKTSQKKRSRTKSNNRRRSKRLIKPELLDSALLEQAVWKNPADLKSVLKLAELFCKSNQESKISNLLNSFNPDTIKAGSPQRFRLLALLAVGRACTGQLAEAEQICQKGLIEFPDALDFHYVLSYLKLSMREYSAALKHGGRYLQLLRYNPIPENMPQPLCGGMTHLSNLQNIVGSACREQKDTDKARLHYQAAITADPGNHLPYLNLAGMLSHLGNTDEARVIITKGLTKCDQVHELRMLEQTLKRHRTVSACMIVRDEEKLLSGCLDSIRNWVDEIIVVDTGSNDKTVTIALSYGAKVFNQQWEGDFAKHRNFSLAKATSDWVLIIDADERICEEDVLRLKELIDSDQHYIVSINVFNVISKDEKLTTFLPAVRLFRRALNLSYAGNVLERLVYPPDAPVARSNVKLKHLGNDRTPEQRRKKFERTHALLEKHLQKNPDDPFALFSLAELLRGAGKENADLFSDEIIKLAMRTVTLTRPNDRLTRSIHLMSLDQLAWACFYKGDLRQALVFAQRALRHKNDYLDPLLLLGHIFVHSKEYEKSRAAYFRYLDIQAKYDPASTRDTIKLVNADSRVAAYYGLAILAEKMGNSHEALKYYRKAIEINPEFLEAHKKIKSLEQVSAAGISEFELAVKNLNEGNYQAVEENFHKVLEEATDKSEAILQIAQEYFKKERYNEAAGYYQMWLDANEQDPEILNELGNCYFKMKQYENALPHYETASEFQNPSPAVLRNLGLTCFELKLFAKATIAFHRYLQSNQEDPVVIPILADLYLNVGDFKSAMPLYERVLRTNPTDHAAIFNLSECYLNLGHANSASIGYRRVLELNPEFEPAKKRLIQLEEVATVLS